MAVFKTHCDVLKIKEKKKVDKSKNNSLFRFMMRLIMIVLPPT